MTMTISEEKWKRLDERLRREDEDRWLSSRYATADARRSLVALYAVNLELARVRLAVSEPHLGAIRFQWWRDALGELEAGQPARKHDVVEALASAALPHRTVTGLIDGHEAAFEAGDRALEPEVLLMRSAVSLLTGPHGWGEHISVLAPAYAAARRGDTDVTGPILPKAPDAIRPAVCHAVLRFDYAAGTRPGALTKRWKVMRAVLSGKV